MSQHDVPEAYGVFKPVGHVVISFPPMPTCGSRRRRWPSRAITGWSCARPMTTRRGASPRWCGPFNAERAQKYGRLIVEELIEHGDDLPQVAESPARGLDAQTTSGRERDR